MPISGHNISCVLYKKETEPTIKINNYSKVHSETKIKIFIPNFTKTFGDTEVSVAIIKTYFRKPTIISEISLDISCTAWDPSSLVHDADTRNANALYDYTPITSQYQKNLSNPNWEEKIGSEFNLKFPIDQDLVLANDNYIIVKINSYDIGYIPNVDQIICHINNQPQTCFAFSKILETSNNPDWIIIDIIGLSSMNISKPNDDLIEIFNLVYPRYTLPAGSCNFLTVEVVGNDNQFVGMRTISPNTCVPTPKPGTYKNIVMNIDKKRKQEIDVTYTFKFVQEHELPDKSVVELKFPNAVPELEYNLKVTFPPIQIEHPNFEDIAIDDKITVDYTTNVITIRNIKGIKAGIEYTIIVRGMRNPSTESPLTDWDIKTYYISNLYQIDEYVQFYRIPEPGIAFNHNYEPGTMAVNSITAFPTNQEAIATYSLSIVPQTKLKPQSKIYIIFPSQFESIPLNPSCIVGGGIKTFSSCIASVKEIELTLDSPYNTGVINIQILDITNPPVTKIDNFEIYSFYDGSIVDETKPQTKDSRKLT